MYKVINSKNLYTYQLDMINQAVTNLNMTGITKYCDPILHPTEDKGCIPLIRMDILNLIKSTVLFMNQEWFVKDTIFELTQDWNIPYGDMPIIVIIPNALMLQDDNLLALRSYAKANNIKTMVLSDKTYVGLQFLLPVHRQLLENYLNRGVQIIEK